MADIMTLKKFEALSPFEIKDELINLAKVTSRTTQSAFLNAGRGNPNWIATTPREGFFLLGQFAVTESKRVMEHPAGVGGMPQAGDQGLDHTHTWGRTYWGGAMFCFLADVEIHRRTGNRLGLQDAMRAVVKASGGLSADWPVSRVFATADAATGTKVFEEFYARMKDSPVSPDLHDVWAKLGVVSDGGTVTLRDDAPLSDVRRAIMQPRAKKT